ncbi:hypothetical protein TNCV_1860531 [Trichonephila clavipes]|nr:hypothetical protein TNCV_1860531 [Trichonephila clavipes]
MRTNANMLPCRAVPAVENFLWNEIDEKNFSSILRQHGTTPLKVKEDVDDVSSELDNGGYRLHFLDETSKTLLLSAS